MTTLLIPTLRRYDLLREAVRSASAGTRPPHRYHIIDNGGALPDEVAHDLLAIAQQTGAELAIRRPGRNLGVAASWNQGFAQLPPAEPWLIVANDDVTFARTTIALLEEAAQADPQGLFFFPGANGLKNAWSLFLQRTRALEEIGWYDEQVSPGYGFFEDNDYSYRLQLRGYRHIPVARCGYGHVDSATVKAMSQPEQEVHWRRYRLAEQNYAAKWGGAPGAERYTLPYNGERPHRDSSYG